MAITYLSVDVADDLNNSGDPTYRKLVQATYMDAGEVTVIDGVAVTADNVEAMLVAYLGRWEDDWLDHAKRFGYEAIAAKSGSSQAHAQRARNAPELLNSPDGHDLVAWAWQLVWDAMPGRITLAEYQDCEGH